jgi:carboxylesterase
MTWHGQINRTIWEIETQLEKRPKNLKLRSELVRTHFLQRFEYDRSLHIPRDDRSFLFLQEEEASAVLLIHGAHGTPAELRELGNFLYGRGYTAYCPRLSRYDLKSRLVSWESWVTMAENALTTLLRYSPKTSVIGLSLGGTVSIILDQLHPIESLILLAPAVHTRLGLKGRFYAVMRHVTPTLFYKIAGWSGEAVKAMDHIRTSVKEIKTPTLVLQARDDHLISTRGLGTLRKWLGENEGEVVQLPYGSHAITRGKAKEEVFDRIYDFTQKVESLQR